MNSRVILLLGFIALLTGCVSPKQVVYFQGVDSVSDSVLVAPTFVPIIRPADVLSVQVNSLNPEKSMIFNPYMVANGGNAATTAGATASLPAPVGYVVSMSGEITIPLLGPVKVAGQTVDQAGRTIAEKLTRFLKEPTVDVRNLNFRISVLGEVARPALFTIPNNQVTIIEALGLAGDVTIVGRRDNVLVVRETNGAKKFARVDLTRRDLFRSPYYYLHPNDIVYVEPGKARLASADRASQITPIVLSALSFVAIILTQVF
ncbi:MAG: polysaccharide export protein [Cytophagales bacterium]|nr:MAG: polysaccharide export protein [Cytophagales bacterium]